MSKDLCATVKGVITYTMKLQQGLQLNTTGRVRLDVPAATGVLSETVQMSDFKGFFILDTLYHDTTQNKLSIFN